MSTFNYGDNRYHAWFSEKQLQKLQRPQFDGHSRGTITYLHENGRHVEVTEVSKEFVKPNFDDAKYLGVVVKWIRCNKGGGR